MDATSQIELAVGSVIEEGGEEFNAKVFLSPEENRMAEVNLSLHVCPTPC